MLAGGTRLTNPSPASCRQLLTPQVKELIPLVFSGMSR